MDAFLSKVPSAYDSIATERRGGMGDDDDTSVTLGKKNRDTTSISSTFRGSVTRVALDPARPRRSSLASGGQDGWTWAAVAPEHQRQVRDENKDGLQRCTRGERKTNQLIRINI